MPRSKKNPLIQALIAELPDANTDWPVEKQLSWLNMMTMAFGIVYGGDAAKRIDDNAKPVELASAPAPQPAQTTRKKAAFDYPFVIDKSGYVLNAKGNRVLSTDVTSAIYDLRGQDGDIGTIIWADGTTGLIGADVVIVAA